MLAIGSAGSNATCSSVGGVVVSATFVIGAVPVFVTRKVTSVARTGRSRDRGDLPGHEHRDCADHERGAHDHAPTDWEVVFDPADPIASIAAGQSMDVKARITPSGDAIAGDYNLNVRANAEEADGTAEIRFTVEASILGAIIGGR